MQPDDPNVPEADATEQARPVAEEAIDAPDRAPDAPEADAVEQALPREGGSFRAPEPPPDADEADWADQTRVEAYDEEDAR